jgi:uncharacterized repeat protein (TIGR03899 family)
MSENSLIKIEGKPLEKLIDVISKGIGTIYKPRAIRKEADAKAYEIEIIERAKSKAIAEGKEIDAEVKDRILERFKHQETKRQLNIDNIVEIAKTQLEQENTVSDEPVNNDWTTRFFNIAADISDNEMQALWGRILAGETKQPKSYSLRTLEIVKNLSKNDAEIFMKVANYAIGTYNNFNFLFKGHGQELDDFGINFTNISQLVECGLIQPGDSVGYEYHTRKEEYNNNFVTDKYVLFISVKSYSPFINVPIYPFTKSGSELLKLIKADAPIKYLSLFAKAFIFDGLGNKRKTVEVRYSDIINREEGFINCADELKDFTF